MVAQRRNINIDVSRCLKNGCSERDFDRSIIDGNRYSVQTQFPIVARPEASFISFAPLFFGEWMQDVCRMIYLRAKYLRKGLRQRHIRL